MVQISNPHCDEDPIIELCVLHAFHIFYSMASAYGAREDSFLSQVERVRREIETHFQRAHKLLQRREAELLAELERLAYEYSGEGITQQME